MKEVPALVYKTCRECYNENNVCPLEDFDIFCPLELFAMNYGVDDSDS